MKEYPKLVLNRNYVLATTMGHSISFVKGESTHVPPLAFAEAIAIGAQPVDGSDPNILETKREGAPPTGVLERNALIMAAIEELVDRNDRKDFTAAGSPAVRAVERELGFDVDGREVATVWQQYHSKKAEQ